jgi:RHS repeat-associated protein
MKTKGGGPNNGAQQMPLTPLAALKQAGEWQALKKKIMAAAKRAAGTKKAKNLAEDPIDVVSGAVSGSIECFRLRGVIPVTFALHYDSSRELDGWSFGRCGWTHTFHRWVERVEVEGAPDEWRMLDHEGDWLQLGELPRDEHVFLRGGRMDVYRRDLTLEVRCFKDNLTHLFERAATDEPYRLRAIVDMHGSRIRVEWEGASVVRVVDTAARELRFTLDPAGRVTRATVWVEERDAQFVDFEYHDAGDLAVVRDALGFAYRYEYDGNHRIVRKTLPNGFRYNYEYDELGRCVRGYGDGGVMTAELIRDDAKREIVVTGQSAGVYVLDEAGNLVEERTLDARSVVKRAYNEYRELVSETDGEGGTTLVEHDERGMITKVTDPGGTETVLEYEDDLLRLERTPRGTAYRYTYDRFRKLIEVRSSYGTLLGFERDEYGRVTTEFDETGPLRHHTYDHRHDRVTTTDARGGLWRVEHDPMGFPIARTDPRGATTRLVRDALGQVVECVYPDGTRRKTVYGPMGRPVKRIDPLGREAVLEHGLTGVLTRYVGEDGGAWSFAYDGEQRISRIVNPRGEAYAFTFDRANNLEREQTFDGRVFHYAYDKAGRVKRILRPDETFREFSYDALGNVVVEASTHGARIFERDPCGEILKATVEDGPEEIVVSMARDELGRIVREEQGPLALDFKRDVRGRPVERKVLEETTRYAYGVLGELRRVEHQGRALAMAFDRGGWEVRRLWQEHTAVDSQWDALGRLVERRVIGSRMGDEPPVNAEAASELGGLPAGYETWRVLSHRRWAYDGCWNVESTTDRIWGKTGYRYDRVGHLVSAARGHYRETFDYDAAGSVVKALEILEGSVSTDRTELWSVGQGNVLRDDDRYVYEVDELNRRRARTDRKTGERTEYLWDVRDQLREVRRPDGVRIRYFYDAFGRRLRKDVWTPAKVDIAKALRDGPMAVAPEDVEPTCETTHYAWHDHELAAELGPRVRRVHVHRPMSMVPLLQSEGGRVYMVVTDHLGAPKDLVDDQGALAWSASHRAWGAVREEWGPGGKPPTVRSPFRLLGQFYDDDVGLALTRFRWWDAETARWLSPDPLGCMGGWNLFAFDANPTGWVDPFGLETNASIGQRGETWASDYLTGQDYTVLGPMQNSSGHGVDIVAVDPNGNLVVVEVKANSSQLSAAQQEGANAFAASRAARSQDWGHPEGDAVELGELILAVQKEGAVIEGRVIRVDVPEDGDPSKISDEPWTATTPG